MSFGACSESGTTTSTPGTVATTTAAPAETLPATTTSTTQSATTTDPPMRTRSGLAVDVGIAVCNPELVIATLDEIAAAHAEPAPQLGRLLEHPQLEFTVISSDDQRSFDAADEVLDYLDGRRRAGEMLVFETLALTTGEAHANFQADVLRTAPDRSEFTPHYFLKGAVTCDGRLLSWVLGSVE